MKNHFLTRSQSLELDTSIFSLTRWRSRIFHELVRRNKRYHRVLVSCFQAELSTLMSDWNEKTFLRFVSLFYICISLFLFSHLLWLSRNNNSVNFWTWTQIRLAETRTNLNHREFWIPITKTKKQTTDWTSNSCNEKVYIQTIKATNNSQHSYCDILCQ